MGNRIRLGTLKNWRQRLKASVDFNRSRIMSLVVTCALAMLLAGARTFAAPSDDVYHLGPDSEPQAGVPQGKVIGPAPRSGPMKPGNNLSPDSPAPCIRSCGLTAS